MHISASFTLFEESKYSFLRFFEQNLLIFYFNFEAYHSFMQNFARKEYTIIKENNIAIEENP